MCVWLFMYEVGVEVRSRGKEPPTELGSPRNYLSPNDKEAGELSAEVNIFSSGHYEATL